MKIVLIAPKTIDRGNLFRFDYAYWNFFLPLQSLGHEVIFFDTKFYGNQQLSDLIKKENPDLLFMIATGDKSLCKDEPFEVVSNETKRGIVNTFNWFCDDVWRFDNFSKNICSNFRWASTPEISYIEKYKDIGYNNIILATWHANSDIYSFNNINIKAFKASFVGRIDKKRSEAFSKLLENCNNNFVSFSNLSFEDMVYVLSASLISVNMSKCSAIDKTQMKARMFEAPAANSMLLTEYTNGLEEFFEIDKECITFSSIDEAKDKIEYCLKNQGLTREISNNGHKRFLKCHTSKIRLRNTLELIK